MDDFINSMSKTLKRGRNVRSLLKRNMKVK